MPVQKIAGKSGYFKTGGSSGSKINITKWSGSLEVKTADTTDSTVLFPAFGSPTSPASAINFRRNHTSHSCPG